MKILNVLFVDFVGWSGNSLPAWEVGFWGADAPPWLERQLKPIWGGAGLMEIPKITRVLGRKVDTSILMLDGWGGVGGVRLSPPPTSPPRIPGGRGGCFSVKIFLADLGTKGLFLGDCRLGGTPPGFPIQCQGGEG